MEKYLIADIECGYEIKKILERNFGLIVLDSYEMTDKMLLWGGWEKLQPWNTLLVLPGNGASIVERYIELLNPFFLWKWPWKAYPKAKRIWVQGENPQAFVGRISTGVMVGIKNVVVIDDVVSSGETCRKIRQGDEIFVPGAEWHAICWVTQKSAAMKGFLSIHAIKSVGTKERKVPINSLSTLVECREIARSYAHRNFGERAEYFLSILETLRK